MAMPAIYEETTPVHGTGALTVPWGTHNDSFTSILVVVTANETIATPTSADATWELIAEAGIGTAGAAGSCRVAAFWARASSGSMADVTVADAGDHTSARMYMVQNVTETGNPINFADTQTVTPAASAISMAAPSSTVVNVLYFIFCANGFDQTTLPGSSNWTNASLSSVSFGGWMQTDLGVGSGYMGGLGERATAGAGGTWANDWDAGNTLQGNITFGISDTETEGGGPTEGTGSAAGTSTVTGTGKSTARSSASSAGVATATSVGKSTARSDASSAGVATATSVGISTARSDASSAGVATATAVGVSTARSDASSAGVATATAVGASVVEAVGLAEGTSTAEAFSQGSIGLAEGTSTATAVGVSTARSDASSAGVATATAVGVSTARSDASSAGVATATAVGTAILVSTGTSAGASTVTAVGKSTSRSDASSAGVATATGVGTSTARSDASSAGTSTATAVGISYRTSTSLTDSQANELIYERMLSGWDSAERTEPVVFESEAVEPPLSGGWVRLVLRPVLSRSETLAQGNRDGRYRRTGMVMIQLFAPRDAGTQLLDVLYQEARDIFEDVHFNGINFSMECSRKPLGHEERWIGHLLTINYSYVEHRAGD